MATVYKGFNVWYCDPTTYEEKEYIGRLEYCITNMIPETFGTALSNASVTVARIRFENTFDDINIITNYSYHISDSLDADLLTLLPTTTFNTTSIEANRKIKLIAENGFYAISQLTTLGQNNPDSYALYDNNNNALGFCEIPILYRHDAVIGFSAIHNFDGVLNTNQTIVAIKGYIQDSPRRVYANGTNTNILTAQSSYWWNSITPFITSNDPYQEGGFSGGGGGTGTFSDTSDAIDFPSPPTLSAVGTGFITLFNPTISQLLALSNYMWNSDPTTIDFWKKVVANPIDLILGLNILPVAIPNTGTKSVVVGAVDTGVNMIYTNTQYVEVDCGSINISEFWGAYLDYSPYTKIEIYLPYCGTHPIIADEIMGKIISVKYHVDILSGACIAYVKCGDSVLYQFSGNCASQIPVTSNQFGDMIRSAISIAASIGTMVATDGATAPMALSTIASTASNSTALKPNVEKSGALGGTAGQLAIQTPYLIVTRPKQCIPLKQNEFIGYPSYVTVTLSDLEGYNEISSIHLENVSATGEELEEIETILKSGVIF